MADQSVRLRVPEEQEISDRHSCLSFKTNKEGVCIPSLVATAETPAWRQGIPRYGTGEPSAPCYALSRLTPP